MFEIYGHYHWSLQLFLCLTWVHVPWWEKMTCWSNEQHYWPLFCVWPSYSFGFILCRYVCINECLFLEFKLIIRFPTFVISVHSAPYCIWEDCISALWKLFLHSMIVLLLNKNKENICIVCSMIISAHSFFDAAVV